MGSLQAKDLIDASLLAVVHIIQDAILVELHTIHLAWGFTSSNSVPLFIDSLFS